MLSDKAVKAAAAREKRYTIGDGNGLVLDVRPGGQKYWMSRTWENGKEKKKVLGRYPDMSLKEAREANILHRRGSKGSASISFSALAEEWIQRRLEVSEGHLRTVVLRLEKYILPAIGARSLDEITPMDVLAACRAAEDSGFLETAHRVRGIIGQVFRYGVASGRCAQNPAEPLRGALKPSKETSYPTLTDKTQIRALVAGIQVYPQPVMRAALWFSLLTFARPGEVRRAEWSEIVGDLWTIPGEKMKMKRVHVVPLCPQVLDALEGLRLLTGDSRYLFPSARDRKRPMSDGGVRAAIRAMGFTKDEFTAHSFRSLASTVLNEHGWPPDVIEKQLAHEDENRVRAAYNRSEYLDQRREMMAWWGEWCLELL